MTESLNPQRGDIALTLGDQTITLRPTFAALAAIEHETGHALVSLARRLANGEAKLAELKSIVTHASRSAIPDLDEQLARVPLLTLHETLLTFLIGAITGESVNAH